MVTAPTSVGVQNSAYRFAWPNMEAGRSAPASPILVRCPFHPCIALAPCFPDDKGGMDVFSAYRDDLFGRDLDPKTQVRYWQVVTNYQRWLGGRPPDVASAKQFLAYLRSRGYRPRSILLYYHALRLFFDFIGQPLRLKLRKPRELPAYHDRGDIEALIAQARSGLRGQKEWQKRRNEALLLTFAYTGMRRGELLNLRVADVDFERLLILVRQGKGRKDRMIPIAERLVVPLRSQCHGKAKTARVFEGLNERSVYRVVSKLARACGLDGFHPHTLRHYFATQLVERGANLRAVQELLGHADLQTTAIYLDISARHLREAIDLLDGPTGHGGQAESRPRAEQPGHGVPDPGGGFRE
jgi:integrase/recombinase XerD